MTNDFWRASRVLGAIVLILIAFACAEPTVDTASGIVSQAATAVPTTTTSPTQLSPTELPPSVTPVPTKTAVPDPTVTASPAATVTMMTTLEDPDPLFPIGATANWTETSDVIGIDGEIEFISATQLVIRNFVFLAAEAPGVDIRLGVGDDFADGVGVSLRDITGKTYEGRSLTLTIPAAAFDGRSFDSIAVFCFDTGDLFDSALVQLP